MVATGLDAALSRAGMSTTDPAIAPSIDFARAGHERDGVEVLEVARGEILSKRLNAEVLICLSRTDLVLVVLPKRTGLFSRRTSEPANVPIPLAELSDLIESDEEFQGPSIYFFGTGDINPDFALRFASGAERDRMFGPIFDAQGGRFARWGVDLDVQNYVEDFERFYAEFATADRDEISGYAEAKYGEFYADSALGLAVEWRRCELVDAANPDQHMRVMRAAYPRPWSEAHPNARRVIVTLASQLFDADLLDGPYDESTFEFGEPLADIDVGPRRCQALITLASFAHAQSHPRAGEWVTAARAAMRTIPRDAIGPTAMTFWTESGLAAPGLT
jgi:hypothetical protein